VSQRDGGAVAACLVQRGGGGSIPTPSLHFCQIQKNEAVNFVRQWHLRLPNTQAGPWKYAFGAYVDGLLVGAALWNNPSARMLPNDWIELRRLAVSVFAPPFTCSKFLGWMVRWFKKNAKQHPRCISYQDLDVHTGTIYKAAGWSIGYVSKRRVRDRSKPRVGTNRMYRKNINSIPVDAAPKARWEKSL
jgi:hypothetical protein